MSMNISSQNEYAAQPISVALRRVKPLFDHAASAAIDMPGLLSELDIQPDLVSKGEDETISLADYYRIQNRISILIGDETCHLSERQLMPGSTDFVLRHVGECTSLLEAMRVIAESYNLLHGGAYNQVETGPTFVDYLINDSDFPYTFEHDTDASFFSMESILIFLHSMLITICPEHAMNSVKSLSVKRPRQDAQCEHLLYWQAPVKYAQSYYLVRFDAAKVTAPMPKPKATQLCSRAVYETILQAVGPLHPAIEKSVSEEVADHFQQGIFEQYEIAEQMRISVATLRRRLSQEGANFRELRGKFQNAHAVDLLRQGYSVNAVADQLGFAEFRSFVRAFKSWNGVTPAAFMHELNK